MRNLALPCLAILISACQTGSGHYYNRGPDISRAVLNTVVTIRADRASEYIQNGEISARNKVSEYYPHCIFELRTVADTARTIQPETFTVTGIRRDHFMAGFRKHMVAGVGGGDYNLVMSTTVISLHSDRQSDVFRLSCQQLDEPYLARHVSLQQMREALGGLFTLE
jgi:hypothetical protein